MDTRLTEFLARCLRLDLETGPSGAIHKIGAIRGAETFVRQGRFDLRAALAELDAFAQKSSLGGLVIPNFSIGMVLMQQAAIQASKFYNHVEIIELHHDQKADAPSGTSLKTAQMLGELGKSCNPPKVEEKETLAGARGGDAGED